MKKSQKKKILKFLKEHHNIKADDIILDFEGNIIGYIYVNKIFEIKEPILLNEILNEK